MIEELGWLDAIKQVLSSSSGPLHYNDITQRIIAQGLRTGLGATPNRTVNSRINESINELGTQSPFRRLGEGMYAINSTSLVFPNATTNPATSNEQEEDESEEQYDIVTSFGMFWRRSAVEWIRTPKLWGSQALDATAVDFCTQVGIYLLYQHREVIYVGRATERPLGVRLYEHTRGRFADRWDGFSWFGFKPVSYDGVLGPCPESYPESKTIPAFEAVLIEALEPRQNRRQGDGLSAVEYMQWEDKEEKLRKIARDYLMKNLS